MDLDEFGFSSLLSLSREYLNALHQAKDPDAPAPYRVEKTREQKAAIGRQMREALAARSKEIQDNGKTKI